MVKRCLLLGLAFLLGGCSLPLNQPKAALQINTSPEASVYLNGSHVGQADADGYYDQNLKSGEYTVKLSVAGNAAQEWEGKITLAPQIVTVLNRNFGPTPEESSLYELYLEPLANKSSTQLSLVTIPENVIVKVDGEPQGFSPLVLENISSGNHVVNLSTAGFKELAINIEMKEGYKLVLSANLARSANLAAQSELTATPSASLTLEPIDTTKQKPESKPASPAPSATPKISPSPTPKVTPGVSATSAPKPSPTPKASPASQTTPSRPYIEVKETPTGWLRVRSEPNGLADNEVARLNTGAKVPYVESSNTGWHKVEYESGKEGWISAQYATLYK